MSDTKISVLTIIVENGADTPKIQSFLSEYSSCIIGRMGIPHCEKNVRIITVVLDGPVESINELTNKLDGLDKVNASVVFANV
ncbi:iron-only hydrogenase system regulator [bacterium]|nr:iron-only hydrogenase system regulator [bacterium]